MKAKRVQEIFNGTYIKKEFIASISSIQSKNDRSCFWVTTKNLIDGDVTFEQESPLIENEVYELSFDKRFTAEEARRELIDWIHED